MNFDLQNCCYYFPEYMYTDINCNHKLIRKYTLNNEQLQIRSKHVCEIEADKSSWRKYANIEQKLDKIYGKKENDELSILTSYKNFS